MTTQARDRPDAKPWLRKRDSSRRTSRCSRWSCSTPSASTSSSVSAGRNETARSGAVARQSFSFSERLRRRMRRSSSASGQPPAANAGSSGSRRKSGVPPTSPARAASSEVAGASKRRGKRRRAARPDRRRPSRASAPGRSRRSSISFACRARRASVSSSISATAVFCKLLVASLVDFLSRAISRSRDAFAFEAIRQPVRDHLAGRAELRADEFRLFDQRLEDDVLLALLDRRNSGTRPRATAAACGRCGRCAAPAAPGSTADRCG